MSVKVTWKGKSLTELKNASKNVLNDAPRAAGEIAVKHFKQNFRKGGFDDAAPEPWQKRKKDPSPGRAILVKKGHLRDSIYVVKYDRNGVTIGSNSPYAKIHNEGGTINHPGGTAYFVKGKKAIFVSNKTATRFAGMHKKLMLRTKAHKIPMPQRKFMGESATLNKKITDWLRNRMNKELGN
jgi:phage gpG-like protein